MKKAIGIIGGMGPEASEKFYGLLIRLAQAKYHTQRNDEFPEIYLASIPVPDFIGNNKDKYIALEMIIERVKQMNNLPIGYYCIACNTGHLLLGDIQKVTKIPFISLLDVVPKAVIQKNIKKVGLMATPTTIRSNMYQNVLFKYGIETVVPSDKDIISLGEIIKETVSGENYEINTEKVAKIANTLLQNGAEGIIEGCTEIPIIFPKEYPIPVFDTLEILARAILEKYYEVK